MSYQLQGKVAIVTGSSSGIGEAVALDFAGRGLKVTLCGRDQDRLQDVLQRAVQASGGLQDNFITVAGDVTDAAVRQEIVSRTVAKFGRLDILFANAGVLLLNQTISTATEETYDAIMNTNIKSTFFLIQAALSELEKTKGTIIIDSASIANMAAPSITISLMSKVALDHLTRCLAVDLGPRGIRVNSICPGRISTRVLRNFSSDLDTLNQTVDQKEVDKTPLRRLGTVQDVAAAVAFLVSDAASFITGEHLKVDGGRSYGPPLQASDRSM